MIFCENSEKAVNFAKNKIISCMATDKSEKIVVL